MVSYKQIVWAENGGQISHVLGFDGKEVKPEKLQAWDVLFDDPSDPILVIDVANGTVNGYLLADPVRVALSISD